MIYKIEFKEQAREDVAKIAQWYNKQRDGLGDAFLAELKQLVMQLISNPYTFQIRRKNIRLGILKRFPYTIAYQIEHQHIIIYSVMHCRQHPKKIFKRAKKK